MTRGIYKKYIDIYSTNNYINTEVVYKDYVHTEIEKPKHKKKYTANKVGINKKDSVIANSNKDKKDADSVIVCNDKDEKDCIKINWNMLKNVNKADPNVWGPTLWFALHNGSSTYPKSASKLTKERMKGYIEGRPYILPCKECQIHASDYIYKNKDNLDFICSSRDNLFKFFVDFHNEVNKRNNKKVISHEEAKKIYYN